MFIQRKSQYVVGSHQTEAPSSMTYASVLSLESVRISILAEVLNDLDILSANIKNSYLNTK